MNLFSKVPAVLSVLASIVVCPAAELPNIVWIIADDLGPELGCMGYPGVRTPNADRLAARGTVFTRAFSTSPVCSASRTALQTGRYQTELHGHHHNTHDKRALPADVPTAVGLLRSAGYFVCNGRGIADDNRPAKSHLNFEYDPKKFFDGTDWSRRQAGQPFFAQIQIKEPHRPFVKATREYPDAPIPPYLPDHPITTADWADYLASVEECDRQLGTVLQRLDSEGLTDNTLILFFGDHGRPHVRCKQWVYDSGLHTPLIAVWPGHIAAGRIDDRLASLLDLMPTTTEAAGISRPSSSGRPLPGRSLLEASAPGHSQLFAARDRCGDAADRIRTVRTEQYRYIRNFHPERPYLQHSGYKKLQYPVLTLMRVLHPRGEWNSPFIAKSRPAEELYDLHADPHELTNLAGSPEHAETLQSLRTSVDRWIEATGDTGAIDESLTVDIDALMQSKLRYYENGMKRRGLDPNLSDEDYLEWWSKQLLR